MSSLFKSLLVDFPASAGVYKMISATGEILYIGKAKDLKKRVSSYLKPDLAFRLQKMIEQVAVLEYIEAKSEAEALLLEARLVKKYQPKFNILLKDDKSFPYIHLRKDHDFPQILKSRPKIPKEGEHFGPFASNGELESTLEALQKIFKLRSCSDNYFASRKRPCLQYQIKRCHAPCVNKISKEDYAELTLQVEQFLKGESSALQKALSKQMEHFSNNLEYEKAAEIRDRIKALSYVQLKSASVVGVRDADVVAIVVSDQGVCIEVGIYRLGQYYGHKAYFPANTLGASKKEILSTFIEQFYQINAKPPEIIVNHEIDENLKYKTTLPLRGKKLELIKLSENLAQNALLAHAKKNAKNAETWAELEKLFDLKEPAQRIEVYDNSHIMGKHAVGAMIVMDREGFQRKEYRAYNLLSSSETGGDDYAMLKFVLTKRLKKPPYPSLMIIDGGKGHMSLVAEIMQEQGVQIPFVCMAKGPNRNAGMESFYMLDREEFTLPKDSLLAKFLQILRDEAHNFAIQKHRKKRGKTLRESKLSDIPGIGAKRKQDLLNYFGSVQAIRSASREELSKISSIGKSVAERIFRALQEEMK